MLSLRLAVVNWANSIYGPLNWSGNMGKGITTTEWLIIYCYWNPKHKGKHVFGEKVILSVPCSVAHWSANEQLIRAIVTVAVGDKSIKRARLMSSMSLGQIKPSFATDQLRASEKHDKTAYRPFSVPFLTHWTWTHLLSLEKWQLEARAIRSSGHLNWNCPPFVVESTAYSLLAIVPLAWVSSIKHLSLINDTTNDCCKHAALQLYLTCNWDQCHWVDTESSKSLTRKCLCSFSP